MRKRVLVAVDDSEASVRVAEFVNDFFGDRDDVDVVALHVASTRVTPMTPLAMGGGMWWTYPSPAATGAEYLLTNDWPEPPSQEAGEAVVEQVRLDADRVEVEVGDVVDAITDVARREDVSLIVVGSNRKGWLERLVTGESVSKQLASSPTRPVLVV